MPLTIVGGVTGSDGSVPVYEPNGRWCWWGLHEIWRGPSGPGAERYVPKVHDYVIDYPTYTTYIVDHIDPVTLEPTLREIRPSFMVGTINETDILFGVGPGTPSDTYRVYLDKSTTPFTLAVDSRLRIAGSMSSYCKIIKGSVVSENGQVVSMVYDTNGNFISNNVALETAAIDNHTNYFIKTVPPCKTTFDMLDGEIVTAVVYDDAGHVVSKRQLLVENTAFIRNVNVSRKYVTHIALECPFMSPTDDHQIEFPLNVPINALNMIGIVHYSDGSMLRLPVDGTRFKMLGISQYLSAIEGQEIDLVLSYALAPNETSYAGVHADGNYITESYNLKTVNPNLSYSVKLFCYPEWVSETYGYTLKWFLFNLDRNIKFDVSNLIQFNPATGTYNPKDYGVTQRKSVSINLRDISAAFKAFAHTQVVDISLYGKPDLINTTPWTVAHEANSSRPVYGVGLLGKKTSDYTLKIDAGMANYTDWLEHLYKRTFPLIDVSREIQPVTPTHIEISYAGETKEIPITQWSTNITFANTVLEDKNVYVTFIRRMGAEVRYLSIAAMLIKL